MIGSKVLHLARSLSFQDVAKAGLQFGDEGEESEDEKAEMEALAEKFQPLLMYLKLEAQGVVHDGEHPTPQA